MLCIHLKNKPTYKIEGGLCIKCENYYCLKCLDSEYYNHIFSKYGKRQLFYLRNKRGENIQQYKENDMLALCYNCVETLNHPSTFSFIKFLCCE